MTLSKRQEEEEEGLVEKMVKTGIKIFARLRPTKKTTSVSSLVLIHRIVIWSSQVYEVGENEDGQLLSFTLPRSESGGAVNNKREIYSFKSDSIAAIYLYHYYILQMIK